jgi:hypothetical protein
MFIGILYYDVSCDGKSPDLSSKGLCGSDLEYLELSTVQKRLCCERLIFMHIQASLLFLDYNYLFRCCHCRSLGDSQNKCALYIISYISEYLY